MEPVIVIVLLLALIGAGAPIFLALGISGLLGLYMARGSMAFFFAPTSLFGQLNSFELCHGMKDSVVTEGAGM